MHIFLASDHAGFVFKNKLAQYLQGKGYEVDDLGAQTLNSEDDYPDFILPLTRKVVQEAGSFGIILGGSGEGEAITANRIKGARAVVYYGASQTTQKDIEGRELDILASTRAHNDANILSLGARFIAEEEMYKAVDHWLQTPFSNEERHMRRITKLDQ